MAQPMESNATATFIKLSGYLDMTRKLLLPLLGGEAMSGTDFQKTFKMVGRIRATLKGYQKRNYPATRPQQTKDTVILDTQDTSEDFGMNKEEYRKTLEDFAIRILDLEERFEIRIRQHPVVSCVLGQIRDRINADRATFIMCGLSKHLVQGILWISGAILVMVTEMEKIWPPKIHSKIHLTKINFGQGKQLDTLGQSQRYPHKIHPKIHLTSDPQNSVKTRNNPTSENDPKIHRKIHHSVPKIHIDVKEEVPVQEDDSKEKETFVNVNRNRSQKAKKGCHGIDNAFVHNVKEMVAEIEKHLANPSENTVDTPKIPFEVKSFKEKVENDLNMYFACPSNQKKQALVKDMLLWCKFYWRDSGIEGKTKTKRDEEKQKDTKDSETKNSKKTTNLDLKKQENLERWRQKYRKTPETAANNTKENIGGSKKTETTEKRAIPTGKTAGRMKLNSRNWINLETTRNIQKINH